MLARAFGLLEETSPTVVDYGETITDEEIAEMISEADSSGTGQVDPVDFQKIVTAYHGVSRKRGLMQASD